MRRTAQNWTTTKKLRRVLLLIGALLPIAGFGGCPPSEQAVEQDRNGHDSSSSGSSGGSY